MSDVIHGIVIERLKALKNPSNLLFLCAYKTDFASILWDYSLSSLQVLDQLLLKIRQKGELQYGQFISSKEGQGFLFTIVFYTMATIAKIGNFTAKWFDYEGFKAYVGEEKTPPFQFEVVLVCILNGQPLMPLSIVTHRLFNPNNAGQGLSGLADTLLKDGEVEYSYLYDDFSKLNISEDVISQHQRLFKLAEQAGILSGFTLAAEAPTTGFNPLLLVPSVIKNPLSSSITSLFAKKYAPTDTNKGTFVQLMGHSNPAAEVLNRLESNYDKQDWLAGLYDAYVYPYMGRMDALVVEARYYTTPQMQPLKILFPYQAQTETAEFVLGKPMILGNHWSLIQVKLISYAVLKQFKQAPMTWEIWQKYYHPELIG